MSLREPVQVLANAARGVQQRGERCEIAGARVQTQDALERGDALGEGFLRRGIQRDISVGPPMPRLPWTGGTIRGGLLSDIEQRLAQVRAVRTQLHEEGPTHLRPYAGDFERVALPPQDCDTLRDALIAENAKVVIEVGLVYGSSALAKAAALASAAARRSFPGRQT